MKAIPLLAAAGLVTTLAGCAVVPADPGYGYAYAGPPAVVAAPPVVVAAPPVVVVRPSYGYYRGYYGGPRYRYWR